MAESKGEELNVALTDGSAPPATKVAEDAAAADSATLGFRLFKKLSMQFVVALPRSTDAKIIKDLQEIEDQKLIPEHVNLNQTFANNKQGGLQTTLLHLAVAASRNVIIDWLIEHKADPNAKNGKGESAVHVAVEGAKRGKGKEILASLLHVGGNMELPDDSGETPTVRAAKIGVDLAKVLKAASAMTASGGDGDPAASASTSTSTTSPLDAEASSSASSLSSSASTSSAGRRASIGGAALVALGATDSSANAVEAALSEADEAEKRKKQLQAALRHAKMLLKGLTSDFEELLSQPNKRQEIEATILKTINDPKNVETLTSKQAIDRPCSSNDRSFLHLATEAERPLLVHSLLKLKADPNKQDSNGDTPLHYAVKSWPASTAVVEVLLADTRTSTTTKSYLMSQTAFDSASPEHAAVLKALDRGKALKIKVARMVAELAETQKAALEAAATSEAIASATSSLDLDLSGGFAARRSSGGHLSGGAGGSHLPGEGLAARGRTGSLPKGRPAPDPQFGTLLALGPSKNPQYGGDYRPSSPTLPADGPSSPTYGGAGASSATHPGHRRVGSTVAANAALRPGVRRGSGGTITSSGSHPASTSASMPASGAPSTKRLGGAANMLNPAYQSFKNVPPSMSTSTSTASGTSTPAVGSLASQPKRGSLPRRVPPPRNSAEAPAVLSGSGTSPSASASSAENKAVLLRGRRGSIVVPGGNVSVSKANAVTSAASRMYLAALETTPSLAATGQHTEEHVALVRQVFLALNPGSASPSLEAIETALQTKGPLNENTIRDIIEVLTVASLRSANAQWDFALLDFHASTSFGDPSLFASTSFMLYPRAMTASSVPSYTSQYSFGTIPSESVDLVTCASSIDRSGAITEKQLQTRFHRDRQREIAEKLEQRGSKLSAHDKIEVEPFGRVSNESTTSARWRDVESLVLNGEDISNELAQLGFVYPSGVL